jgi:hypothetical protein
LLITLFFISIQIFVKSERDLGYKHFIKNSILYNKIMSKKERNIIVGQFEDENFNKIVNKIKNITTSNDSLMVDWQYVAMATYFKLDGDIPIHTMPILVCYEGDILWSEKPEKWEERPLIIHSNNRPLDPLYRLYILFESSLVKKIEKEEVDYVLLSPWMGELHDYFSGSESFKEIFSVGRMDREDSIYRLYRVVKPERSKNVGDPVFTETFRKSIRRLKRWNGKKYELFRDKYIYGVASLSPAEFEIVGPDFR